MNPIKPINNPPRVPSPALVNPVLPGTGKLKKRFWPTNEDPGLAPALVGFIITVVGFAPPVALVPLLLANSWSKRAGYRNTSVTITIILNIVLTLLLVLFFALLVAIIVDNDIQWHEEAIPAAPATEGPELPVNFT